MFGKLPLHQYGHSQSVLEYEDFSQTIQLHLQERTKDGYIRAEDIVDFLSSPEMQEQFPEKKVKITVRTAQKWLHKLEWWYGKKHNGMYIDGHEWEDVVTYCAEFLQRMKEYMRCMVTYDNDGNPLNPQGFQVEGGQFRIILVTHDESTFYANDQRKTAWTHSSDKAVPQPKGEGQSLMISDFLTSEWGHLVDGDEEARIIFKAGKNRDGYFASEDLLKQVDKAIDIFEGTTKHAFWRVFYPRSDLSYVHTFLRLLLLSPNSCTVHSTSPCESRRYRSWGALFISYRNISLFCDFSRYCRHLSINDAHGLQEA
ncbi:hypothetical protein M422DRAFT_264432 [Sphaerobolus stellatus SS14]|uniref:Uncharacterized protein n=1 Tax=Sphaerobolus stellatus (strain SS14) TaxID=990650 RepID=A0A0C9UW74_SPHS4|nr:hypothetical protein M422DRAFT_264432 [Sphaerobolus stellatus SS14]